LVLGMEKNLVQGIENDKFWAEEGFSKSTVLMDDVHRYENEFNAVNDVFELQACLTKLFYADYKD